MKLTKKKIACIRRLVSGRKFDDVVSLCDYIARYSGEELTLAEGRKLFSMLSDAPPRAPSPTKSINAFTDWELARMVRESIYTKNIRFGDGPTDARFLLVLAVPYGNDEGVETLGDALDGFARLLQDEDWAERSIQVYDHAGRQRYSQVSREDCERD